MTIRTHDQVGLYGLVTGSLLIPLMITDRGAERSIQPSSGGAGGLRLGYLSPSFR